MIRPSSTLPEPTYARHDETPHDPFAGPAISGSAPSTDAQREIWAGARMGDDASLAFNESVSVTLRGALDEAALRQAVRDLVARHEALRATFTTDGLTMLVLEEPAEVPLPLHDWAAEDPDQHAALLQELETRAVEQPFDLVRSPLVRFDLVRLAHDEHVLVITAHHIVCDGWSFGVIAAELAALYTARHRNAKPTLESADRLTDYARSLLSVEAQTEVADAEQYWLKVFEGSVPLLDLPSDRGRLPTRSYRARREDRVIAPDLVQRLTASGRRQGASLFATLFAAYSVLLHRLSGQDDLVVGIPAAGQATAGLKRLVGHLVRMLPVRLRVDSAMSVKNLLAAARTGILDASEHQQLTLATLLQRLPGARDPSRPPLVSAVFNLDRGIGPSMMPFDGLEATLRSNPRRYENFDVFLNAVELDGALTVECQYNADLFDATTVQRWLEMYELLLGGIADSPEADVGALPVLTAHDREIIERINESAAPLPIVSHLHALIEAQATRAPDAVAVEWDGVTTSYAELNARANRVAGRLRRLGVRRGVFVGLCVERSTELVVGLLGILKAGGAYVPLDPAYPLDRLAFMAADCGFTVLVTQRAVHAATPLPVSAVVLLDDEDGAIASESATNLPVDDDAASLDSSAWAIYTSGSTGKPKAVVVTHRSAVNFTRSWTDRPGVNDRDIVLAVATISFDMAVIEILVPLTVGARVVMASRDTATDGASLMRLVDRSRVTCIFATPSSFRLLLAAGWQGGQHVRLACGGEAWTTDLAEALCARAGTVWNMYGPTEITAVATVWLVKSPVTRLLIGGPLANARVYVLDSRRRPVPIGASGELYVGGMGVATGYLNRPELTAERFLRDPFVDAPDARMYRTGDVVRLWPDGNLEYLGRNDTQVKVRGYRIELGEIEDVLARHASVRQAVVVAREDQPGDVRLVAYVADQNGRAAPDAELRAHVKASLPDYMVPPTFVHLATIPQTASGKVDRRALPAPLPTDGALSSDFVEPRTETERLLAGLWAEALRVRRVSVRDDFFALGGHSLLAAQILARMRRDYGVDLAFRTVFQAPTIEQFAALVDQRRLGAVTRAATIPRRGPGTRAPLSVVQERLWALEELDPNQQPAHNHASCFRLKGTLDVPALSRALASFVRRHDMLRTTFRVDEHAQELVVAPDVPWDLAHVDLSNEPAATREASAGEVARAQQLELMDLSVPPLARVTLIRLAADEHLLLIVVHALIWDGWSFDIFIQDVAAFYDAEVTGAPVALDPLPVTFGDFAAWQREWLNGPEMARQIAWWREQLAGPLPVLALPTDHPRPAVSRLRGGSAHVMLPTDELEALQAFASAEGTTLFIVLFTAYVVLLHRATEQRDLVVGCPMRARSWAETENMVGTFVNTVALRIRLEPTMSCLDLLRSVRETAFESFGHQEMPIELLGSKPPELRVLFSMQDARTRPAQMQGLTVSGVPVPIPHASNDLMLWTMQTARGLLAALSYSSELFDALSADRLLRRYRHVLRALRTDPLESVTAIEILPEEELALLLGEPAADAPVTPELVPDAVAATVTAAADVAAVVAGGEALTYQELDARAAEIAGALATAEVPGASRVAILLGPGTDWIVALLGVLRTGASVVLADPTDPEPYLSALLAPTSTAAIITNRAGRAVIPSAARSVTTLTLDAGMAASSRPAVARVGSESAALMLHAPNALGQPDRVVCSHGDLAALLQAVRDQLGVRREDVVVSCLPPTADSAVVAALLPLTSGAELVIAGDVVATDGESFRALLHETNATVAIAPLETWRALAATEWRSHPGFRAVVVGPPVRAVDLDPLLERADRVFTTYGYADCGIWAAMCEIAKPAANDSPTSVRLGSPLGTARMFVLDSQLRPAPVGVPGALYIGGPAVQRNAATGDAATSDDGVSSSRAVHGVVGGRELRLVRTGDRARRLADGTFEHLGADSTRAWIAGARIDLTAIEQALLRHSGLAAAAVRPHDDRAGIARLVAYVVPQPSGAYTDTELRAVVRAALPRRMVPQRIVALDALPMDAMGRIDRTRLASPYEVAHNGHPFVAPRTPEERVLAAAWQEMLGVERVSVTDNFFMLGGFSLLCFRLVERLRRETGVRLNPRLLLMGTLEQAAVHSARTPQARAVSAAEPAASTRFADAPTASP